MPSSASPAPPSARRLRMRNGSSRNTSHSSGSAIAAPSAIFHFSPGWIVTRNENVSGSISRKSRNVSVSWVTSNFRRDSAISTTIATSDSAAAMPGRPNTAMPRQHAKASVSSDSDVANGPYSV